MQTSQGKGWQVQNSEHSHPVLVKFMSKLLQKYSTHYLAKVLVAGNKTIKDLPKYWETYTLRETCACIKFWKNVETQIISPIMHRQNNWMHNMKPVYTQ